MRRTAILCLMLLLLGGGVIASFSGAPSPAAAMEESDRLWMVGEHAFQDGLYSLARRTLERFVARHPNDRRVPDATLLLGKARFAQKTFPSALEAFKQAETYSPAPGRPGEARFWEAETVFRMERYSEARDLYDQILTEDASSVFAPDALYGRGWSNRELKQRDLAIADFRRLLSTYPDHASASSARYYLARTLLDARRPEEAVPLLQSFQSKYPDHPLLPSARYALAEALLESGDSKEGVAELREFLAAYPDHEMAPQARRLIADTVLRKGTKADLAEEYKSLMTQSPPTAESLYEAGVVASRLGRGRDAETAWARLRKEFPDNALASRAALDLAQAAFSRNAFKEAATFAQAASKSGEAAVRAEGLLLLGESELRLKHHAAALQAFQSALDGSGLESALRYRALAGSGLALEEQQKWAQAARYYDEVAAKSPDKTLREWAKERRAAIAPKLKSSSEGGVAPKLKSSSEGGVAPKLKSSSEGGVAPKSSTAKKTQSSRESSQ